MDIEENLVDIQEQLITKYKNIIRQWIRENHMSHSEEESISGSYYFLIRKGTQDRYGMKVRISDHPPKKDDTSVLQFRVDMLNPDKWLKRKLKDKVYHSLDNAWKREKQYITKKMLEDINNAKKY